MMPLIRGPLLSKIALGLGVSVGVYSVVLALLLTPNAQRFALYAHKFHTLFAHHINDGTQFGFAKGQVTPFEIVTPDGETLFAWHVLPLNVYVNNESGLRDEATSRGDNIAQDITTTQAFKLLRTYGDAKVVVSFHGNAGHIAQGWRPETLRALATQPHTHVVAIDYRGFGKSTGSPTEAGLITDGIALVDWVLKVANVPPERIVILGQSLGTAVASAVGLHFVDPGNTLVTQADGRLNSHRPLGRKSTPSLFAGIVLVAPFFSLPSLLLTYRIGGFLPLLMPLRIYPTFANYLTSHMIDKWPTAERLATYYQVASSQDTENTLGMLQLIHAINDRDISFRQTEMICRKIIGNEDRVCQLLGSGQPEILDRTVGGKVDLRIDILKYGGHNRVTAHMPVLAAVSRAFLAKHDVDI